MSSQPCQVSRCSRAPSSPDCQPLPAHLLSSGRHSLPPPRSIRAPSGRIRDCKAVSGLKRGSRSLRSPGRSVALSGQGRHHGWWARNHALHPGGVSAKDCCLSCLSTLATPTSGPKNYNSQQAIRRLATPGMHCPTQSQAELTWAHRL